MEEFLEQIKNDHHNFDKGVLSDHVGTDPLVFFRSWYKEAFDLKQPEAHAMSVSTVDAAGKPSSRIVYLKELNENGFVFYTNYASHKGQDLDHNPAICALFFWHQLERQIRIEGTVTKVSEAESDAYFASRPRGSQLGAWASMQSARLDSREELENRLEKLAEQYPDAVPRPPHWGGYQIDPQIIEFWQGRPSRLHDRIVFEKKTDGQWEVYRKNP